MTNTIEPAENRTNLAIGFALPIVGLTLGLLSGLILTDTFRNSLQDIQNWIWLSVNALICASLVAGGHFSAKAKLTQPKGAARGAAALNLVLASIWIPITLFISLVMGSMASGRLSAQGGQYPDPYLAKVWPNEMAPAIGYLLLSVITAYLFVALRSKGSKN